MDFKAIEKKWQERWEKERLFEAEPNQKKKFFLTFPYPYVNGAPHIGHSYTAFRTDVYARFKRMQGYNVLYPQGFHATGEPIIGVIERLKNNDKVQIETLRKFGTTDKDIEKFKKSPKYLVDFWISRWVEDLKMSGFSIDWRRSFVTTQLTPTYSKFIEWQYKTLRKKGYVVQGTHPVIWCPKCKSPTGDHDRLEGEGASVVIYAVLKFQYDHEKAILPAATLRPETIYGVTNMWVNPDVEYVKARIDNETWIISKECAEKLKEQLKTVKIIKTIKGREMLGKRCIEPLGGKDIPILPAEFVDPNAATGVVMSVPSHAPYDWIALKELIEQDKLEHYGTNSKELEPISLITSPGLGEQPAIEICKELGISTLKEKRKLDYATSIIYKKEFHQGVLNERCNGYVGLKVAEAKEIITEEFVKKKVADLMAEMSENVVCRCGTKNYVKILEDQWFLKFSDKEWKEKVRECLSGMTIMPEDARNNFENTINWLRDKACARRTGLGTPIPWDKTWIVETLSDSTIYMAYYTIAHIIKREGIDESKLTDAVFDYIFLGKGDSEIIAKSSGIERSVLEEMKKEFDYFYPVDFRNSGKDLIQNHLTFYIFHHTAIFPRDKWPKIISVNGWVNIEGEKMSKSKGNIFPLRDMLESHGADMMRINMTASGEGLTDADWRIENLKGYKSRYEFLFSLVQGIGKCKERENNNADYYIQSAIEKSIMIATENYEETKFRTVVQYALFETTNELRWYLNRVGGIENANRRVMRNVLGKLIKILAPLTPHICEEMWVMLGNKTFVSVESWPGYDKNLMDEERERGEDFIKEILEDVEEVKKIAKIKPHKISIFVAEDWKFDIYRKIIEDREKDISDVIRHYLNGHEKNKDTVNFVQKMYKKRNELAPAVRKEKQLELLNEAKNFLEKNMDCEVRIINAQESSNEKARASTPAKPGIFIE